MSERKVSAGPANDLTDLAGIRVGHHQRTGGGFLTGTTVVLAPPGGMVAGVDVRGGGPGTRETDLLNPLASAERIHAILLTGGSAYGLAAADGAMTALEDLGVGFDVGLGLPGRLVPLVPAAVLFDLGRGGDFRARPDAGFGAAAVAAAASGAGDGAGSATAGDASRAPGTGSFGAGTGAVCGGLKGGLGSASVVLPSGVTVAALVAVNAAGAPVDRRTGQLLGERWLLTDDGSAGLPTPAEREAVLDVVGRSDPRLVAARSAPPTLNTTLAVVATDAALTKAQCAKLAGSGQDGFARALDPVHTSFDGDTVFGVSTATRSAPDPLGYHEILCAAADVVTRAICRAVLAAPTVRTEAGHWPGYRDLAPSATSG